MSSHRSLLSDWSMSPFLGLPMMHADVCMCVCDSQIGSRTTATLIRQHQVRNSALLHVPTARVSRPTLHDLRRVRTVSQ